jgi:hypothetical protein
VRAAGGPFALIALALLLAACGGPDASATPSRAVQNATAAPTPSGPNAAIEPRSGPPGTSVTVSGSGWPSGASITIRGDGAAGRPYASVTASEAGAFRATFILERKPDGGSLSVGRFDLLAESDGAVVRIPFQVQTPRPVAPAHEGG